MNTVGLVILLLVGLAVLWLVVVVYTAYLLTHPPRRSYAWAVARSLPGDPGEVTLVDSRWLAFETWELDSRGRRLGVWDIRGLKADGPVVILTHGWGDSRVVMLNRVAGLAPHCSRIIAWDMPGHGDAGGTCTLGVREVDDLMALVERVQDRKHSSEPRAAIVLYGFSLGAGVSLAAAASLGGAIDAVIAEAPYRGPQTPARNVLRTRDLPYRATLPVAIGLVGAWHGEGLSWAIAAAKGERGVGSAFDRAAIARRIGGNTRVTVIAGDQDAICPLDDAREIAEAVPNGRGELVTILGGTHTSMWIDPACASVVQAAVARALDESAATDLRRNRVESSIESGVG